MDRSLAVLLVEDEALTRMVLSDMLDELGHRIAGEAGDIESASSYAMTAEDDLAILDINLHGRYVDPVADLIALRGKPFVFASGYGPEVLPSLLRRRPLLRKPVALDDLKLTIDRIFEPAERCPRGSARTASRLPSSLLIGLLGRRAALIARQSLDVRRVLLLDRRIRAAC
ncbi:CheY-like chemotaxis protein [Bradyrhizobium japonicum]